MQWVRAACVRPAPCMRVCARSYLGRASIAKTVADILQQLQFKCLVCLSVTSHDESPPGCFADRLWGLQWDIG